MAVKLTDKHVASLRAPKGKRVDAFDALEPGLVIRVSDSGRRTWYFRYRVADGRQPRLKLGTYPTTTIVEAREKAHAARRIVELGGDPAATERAARAKAQAQPIRNIGDLSEAYFTAGETGLYRPKGKVKSAKTVASERRLYERHVKAKLGGQPIAEIGRAEIRTLTRAMLARGIKTQTNHTFALIRQMLSFAVEEELLEVNPAKSMSAPAPKGTRERVLNDAEIKAFWAALEDPTKLKDAAGEPVRVGQSVTLALRLVALLLQRRIEVAGMRVDELDLKQATWLLAADRTKNGQPHVVPLPPKAIELIRAALAVGDGRSAYVFPSPRSANGPIGEDALTRAMGAIVKALGLPLAGPHDLRRTGASALASERLGVQPFIVSQVLNHITDGGGGSATTRRHYNVHSYVVEKRRALEAWEGLLLEIVGEKPPLRGATINTAVEVLQ